ncbi:MAG: hypothetical protein LBM98_02515 [Oscillospiraceae bacterium]|jgi:predicted  nucleic acid-binding Zn-ribbon protein|nr:hypothetical protein [Oscillospiraceae bacterium]
MNFEEFKERATETAEFVAGKTVQFAKFAGEKVGTAAKVAKLNAEILAEKDNLRKAYARIGKLYVELYAATPHEDIAAELDIVHAAQSRIDELKTKIDDIKTEAGWNGGADADYDSDFENDFNEGDEQ